MADNATKTLTVQRKQAQASKKATLDLLRSKRRRRREVTVQINGEETTLIFEAISSHEMDKLIAKYPPTKEQQLMGAGFNPDQFNPALIAACLAEPKLSEEEVLEIWTSDEWSQGELMTLFNNAWQLTMEGLDVPFFENGSGATLTSG